MTDDIGAAADRPLWKKLWEFPLLAMIVALALLIGTLGLTSVAFRNLPSFGNDDADLAFRTLLGVAAVVAMYKLAVPRLGRQRKDDLPLSGSVTDTLFGIGIGAALFTLMVGIAAVFGAYRVLGWGGTEDMLEIFLLTGLVAGVVEEILFRGVVFRFLEEFAGSLIALIVSSLIFGFLHLMNDNATVWSSVAISIEAGILLGGAYMLTRNLWLAIGLHAGWNVTQGFIWGVPVSGNSFIGMVESGLYGPDWLSGGAFGLEASVIALAIATAAGVGIVRQATKEEGHWVRPVWLRNR